ncbi:MAG: hypothetical protein ACO1OO_08565 [Flavisolibacter sp.]
MNYHELKNRGFNSKDIHKPLDNSAGLMFSRDGNHYSINYLMVRYTMPTNLAQSLHDWHRVDPKSKKGGHPLVADWFARLDSYEKRQIKRVDLNTNSLIEN